MNNTHEANRKSWDAVSPYWQARIDKLIDWRKCANDPTTVLSPQELKYLEDLRGKSVAVLGSGDNLVVFALAGMGAHVTSIDISQVQLDTASRRATELELQINFLQADVVNLGTLEDSSFDLVYTGGHVAVWVSNLDAYYAEAYRILNMGGIFLVNEYHPFRRIWQDLPLALKIESGYFRRGPYQYDRSEDVPGALPGSLPSYEFHWTISDYVYAMTGSGCELIALDEFGDEAQTWEGAPLKGLPSNLLLVGLKRGLI